MQCISVSITSIHHYYPIAITLYSFTHPDPESDNIIWHFQFKHHLHQKEQEELKVYSRKQDKNYLRQYDPLFTCVSDAKKQTEPLEKQLEKSRKQMPKEREKRKMEREKRIEKRQ